LAALGVYARVKFVAVQTLIAKLAVMQKTAVVGVSDTVGMRDVHAIFAFFNHHGEIAIFIVISLLAIIAVCRIDVE
jgi:hypothetical protein